MPQNELVLPLKDPTSDMAVIARNGSKLVKDIRDKKEASKSRARFWEVAGSKMGQITGALKLCPPPLPPSLVLRGWRRRDGPSHGQRGADQKERLAGTLHYSGHE